MSMAERAGAAAPVHAEATVARPTSAVGMDASVRTWTAPVEGTARNVFAIETDAGYVVIDAPLRTSDGAAAGAWLRGLGRPILGVLLTHAHPDHTFGLARMLAALEGPGRGAPGGEEVPVYATRALADAIRASDEVYARAVAGYFGTAETERDRRHPTALADPSSPLVLGGVPFAVTDVGAVESDADCVWTSPALPGAVFSGDLVMHRTHLSLVQGNSAGYRAAVHRLATAAASYTLFFAGHGGLVPAGAVGRQLRYLDAYRAAVRQLARGRPALDTADKAELVVRMTAVEPSPLLAFLIPSGADAVARELAAEDTAARAESGAGASATVSAAVPAPDGN